jgi:hypothetical protein
MLTTNGVTFASEKGYRKKVAALAQALTASLMIRLKMVMRKSQVRQVGPVGGSWRPLQQRVRC